MKCLTRTNQVLITTIILDTLTTSINWPTLYLMLSTYDQQSVSSNDPPNSITSCEYMLDFFNLFTVSYCNRMTQDNLVASTLSQGFYQYFAVKLSWLHRILQ